MDLVFKALWEAVMAFMRKDERTNGVLIDLEFKSSETIESWFSMLAGSECLEIERWTHALKFDFHLSIISLLINYIIQPIRRILHRFLAIQPTAGNLAEWDVYSWRLICDRMIWGSRCCSADLSIDEEPYLSIPWDGSWWCQKRSRLWGPSSFFSC